MLAAVAGHRLEALYRIARSLGLRRGEVLGLRWADIDVPKRTLRITGALQRVQGKLERSEPKTRAGARALLLPDVLVDMLAEHQREAALKVAGMFGQLAPPAAAPSDQMAEQAAGAGQGAEGGEQVEPAAEPVDDQRQPDTALERLDTEGDGRLYNAEDDDRTACVWQYVRQYFGYMDAKSRRRPRRDFAS